MCFINADTSICNLSAFQYISAYTTTKLTRFKNANISIDRCPDHDVPTAVWVHFTYTIVCKAFITTSVDPNPPISMVDVKPEPVVGC